MKNKTKNMLIKKRKGRKTKKMKMRGGGVWDYFTSWSIGIPGLGSVGKCQSKQYYDPKYGLLEQTCSETPIGPVYKTQYPDSKEADGAATPTKSWYQFW
jgi:hypothetical protein